MVKWLNRLLPCECLHLVKASNLLGHLGQIIWLQNQEQAELK